MRCTRTRGSYPYTVYRAAITFISTRGESARFVAEGGRVRGHDQTLDRASMRWGERVPVLYGPENLEGACRDTIMDKWGAPADGLRVPVFIPYLKSPRAAELYVTLKRRRAIVTRAAALARRATIEPVSDSA